MTKVIIMLNGPKHSGKDTIGNEIEAIQDGVECFKFAQPLRVFIKTTLSISDAELEARKDTFVPLFGMTIRQAMIAYSEDFCKPKFGSDYFGRLALEKIEASEARMVVITDSGFAAEAETLVNFYGPERIVHIQLHREGKNFGGDSRSYFLLNEVCRYEVHNNGTPIEAAWEILAIASASGADLKP